ncbi:MAG: hypothetical protein U5L72_08930 [Bacteroidales bacterium]|nr:hypothetical protein [Bacteroidales bacterium]
MKRLTLIILLFAAAGFAGELWSCTTFLMSGKYTPDGRPILYKHRDTGTLDNALVFFTDGKYQYIGLVDSKESWKQEVWEALTPPALPLLTRPHITTTAATPQNLPTRRVW